MPLSCVNWKLYVLGLTCVRLISAITMEQFDQSLDMMRNGCAPKFKLTTEQLNNFRIGIMDDNNQDLKCYTKCVAQLAGTLTKKGDFSVSKALAQIPIILPKEMQENAKAALSACKDAQKDVKDSCDRVYYVTKCVRDFNPATFKFP